ncbi:hypothetical protein AB6A40_001874 [Gnathostoma spinigerum]|uniref:Uncharacterized protein n=1 Tax=Gnathostoma spinigerum TaxID=75299 RepID=A0ABD6EFS7_9BILA
MKRSRPSSDSDDDDNLLRTQLRQIDEAANLSTRLLSRSSPSQEHSNVVHRTILSSTDVNHYASVPSTQDFAISMREELDKLWKEKEDLEGRVEMYKFKAQNSEKEVQVLQAEILSKRREVESLERKNENERLRHEQAEMRMREELSCQELDVRTKQFRDRLNMSVVDGSNSSAKSVSLKRRRSNELDVLTKKVTVPGTKPASSFVNTFYDSMNARAVFTHHSENNSEDTFIARSSPERDAFRVSAKTSESPRKFSPRKQAVVTCGTQTVNVKSDYDISHLVRDSSNLDVLLLVWDKMKLDNFWDTSKLDLFMCGGSGHKEEPVSDCLRDTMS